MVSFQVVKGRDQANKASMRSSKPLNALSQERLGVCVSYFHSSCNPYACFRSAFTTGFRMQNR
jgi:hypothetical protein